MNRVTNWVMALPKPLATSLVRDPKSDLATTLESTRTNLPVRSQERLEWYVSQDDSYLVGVRLRFQDRGETTKAFEALVPVVMTNNRVVIEGCLEEAVKRAHSAATMRYRHGYFGPDTEWVDVRDKIRLVSTAPTYSETFGQTLDVGVIYLEYVLELGYNPFQEFIHDGWAGCRVSEG